MALHLSLEAREQVELLEKLRGEAELFWRQFNSLRFDSWSEKRLLVRVGLLGGQLLGGRLARLGCSLRLVDGKTGEPAGLHRRFVLKVDGPSWANAPGDEENLTAPVACPPVVVRDHPRKISRQGHDGGL